MMAAQPDFNQGPDRRRITMYLREVPLGETVTWEKMVADLNLSKDRIQTFMGSVLKSLAAEGKLFDSVHGVGKRRLFPNEAHEWGRHRRKKQQRAAVRNGAALREVARTANDLEGDARLRLNGEITYNDLLANMASEKTARKLRSVEAPKPVITAGEEFLEHLRRK